MGEGLLRMFDYLVAGGQASMSITAQTSFKRVWLLDNVARFILLCPLPLPFLDRVPLIYSCA
jgi:hypothetical protein